MSFLYTLSFLSAEDTVNWARRSCRSVIMDPDTGTLILTFCFSAAIEQMAFLAKQYTNAVSQRPPECCRSRCHGTVVAISSHLQA